MIGAPFFIGPGRGRGYTALMSDTFAFRVHAFIVRIGPVLTVALLAACLLWPSAGCSDQPQATAPEAGQRAGAVGATCPPAGRLMEVADLGLFRAHQRVERELLDGLDKERRDAEADQSGTESAAVEPAPPAKAAPGKAPATRAARVPAVKSGPWTIAMAPSSFPKGSLERARDQFRHFTGAWLARIRDNMRFSEHKAQVVQSAGAFLARFSRLESESRELEVKTTDTPGCPFVGVLRYLEHRYEARGPTPDQAVAGPFRRVKTVRVTEIFRYSGDAWVH